jgi:hypothetical protein
MDKNKVLDKIRDNLAEHNANCRLYEEGEISPGRVLVCEHKALGVYGQDGTGQYMFADLEMGAEGVDYFVCLISYAEDLFGQDMPELRNAICLLNYYMPYGAFCLGAENDLSFKYTLMLPDDMDQKTADELAEMAVVHAMDGYRKNIAMLLSVAQGKLSADDIIDMFDVGDEEA